jgi:hypothetical protein
MRTSNKILLGTFVAAILIMTSIYVTLYAKIKSGDLVDLRSAPPPQSMEKHATPNIKHVMVTGMEECRVIYSDTPRLELTKNWKEHLKWKVEGDSLVIEGIGNRNYVMGERVYVPIDLYLPADVNLYARYSKLFLRGSEDSAKAFSRVVNVQHGHVFVAVNSHTTGSVYWKNLIINSQNGIVSISPEADIQEAVITLNSNAEFFDEGARFDSISFKVDSTSKVNLRAGSLEKLKNIKP